jgi:hypothetical protein
MSPKSLDDFDRALSTDETLVPSSGFVGAVMEMVTREAAVPPPIAFPWKRLAYATIAWCGVAAIGAWTGLGDLMVTALVGLPAWARDVAAFRDLLQVSETGVIWTAGALLIAFASSALPLRLIRP